MIEASFLKEVTVSEATETSELPNFAKELKPENIDSLEEADQPIRRIKTINERYEGQENPETGVRYESKIIELPNGEVIEGVFPEFESAFNVQLKEDEYKISDARHARIANDSLKEQVANDPELRGRFTPEQLEEIEYGETPDGYTWHHSEEPGVLQLIESKIHEGTKHTGGRNIWGGGTDHR